MREQNEQINVRIDAATKTAAEDIFRQLGLSATDAVRMFYRQVAFRQGLPFQAMLADVARNKKQKFERQAMDSIQKHRKTYDDLAGR